MLGPGAAAAGRPGEHSAPELAARGRRPTQPFIAPGPRPQLRRVCISKRGEPRGRESKGETRRGRGVQKETNCHPKWEVDGPGPGEVGTRRRRPGPRRGARRAGASGAERAAAPRLARHLPLPEGDRGTGGQGSGAVRGRQAGVAPPPGRPAGGGTLRGERLQGRAQPDFKQGSCLEGRGILHLLGAGVTTLLSLR